MLARFQLLILLLLVSTLLIDAKNQQPKQARSNPADYNDGCPADTSYMGHHCWKRSDCKKSGKGKPICDRPYAKQKGVCCEPYFGAGGEN